MRHVIFTLYTQVFQKSVVCMKKSKRPDEIWFVYIWSSKLYIRYHGNRICGHNYQLPLKLIFENISLKAEQKTTVACYQTCYTNSTEGSIHGSFWKNQQSPKVFLHNAKNDNYWIAVSYRTNTNKLTFLHSLMVSNPSSHVRLFCLAFLWSTLTQAVLTRTVDSTEYKGHL